MPKLPERKEDRSTSSRQGNHEILTWKDPKRNLSFNKKELTTLKEVFSEYDRITGLHVSRSSLETVINMEHGSGMEKQTGVEPESAVYCIFSCISYILQSVGYHHSQFFKWLCFYPFRLAKSMHDSAVLFPQKLSLRTRRLSPGSSQHPDTARKFDKGHVSFLVR
jgi:hypothetical protein